MRSNCHHEFQSFTNNKQYIIAQELKPNSMYNLFPVMSSVNNYSNFSFADNCILNVLYCQDSTVLLKFDFYLTFVSILREEIEIIWVGISHKFW